MLGREGATCVHRAPQPCLENRTSLLGRPHENVIPNTVGARVG